MKTISLLCISLFILTSVVHAQNVTVRYYNDKSLLWEVPRRSEAKYRKVDTKDENGTLISELYTIRKNRLIKKESYKKNLEPTGVWLIEKEGKPIELNYNFTFYYTNDHCLSDESIVIPKEYYFKDDSTTDYISPKTADGKEIPDAFMEHFIKPVNPLVQQLSGTVRLIFTITKDGIIKDIDVINGLHVILDKEAIRAIYAIQLANPPSFNGVPTTICIEFPISLQKER